MNILNITDGTTTVNLLNLADGFSVDDWRQKIAQYKGGGTWQQSALTDGSRLVAKAFDNITEEIPMPGIKGATADIAAVGLAVLLMLLEKASSYWEDDWRSEPVWLESQNDCETNKQYAIIYAGGFPDLGDPYSHAYLETAVMTDLVLRLVRGHWADNQPLVGTALPISARETWDSRWFGNVDDTGAREVTTAAEVFSVNKRCEVNITHVYHVAAPDVWTDLVAAGPPFGLFPVGVAAGDFLIIGIECPAGEYYPFSNLIFNIGTLAVNLDTIWEYWDGGAPWGDLDANGAVLDNTDTTPHPAVLAFTVAGVNGVWWTQPSDWVRENLNVIFPAPAPNVLGYWVRCRVTNLPGAATVPTQINRDIYTCTWPYIEVQADDITGHIDAINTLITECRSDSDSPHVTTGLGRGVRRVIGGLRSVDRGDEFVSILNIGDEDVQNPTGISTQIIDVVDTSFVGSPIYPVWRYLLYAPAVDRTLAAEFNFFILNEDFHGTYRIFMRVRQVGGSAGDIGVGVEQSIYQGETVIKTSEVQYTTTVTDEHLLEFGEFTLPGIVPLERLASNRFVFSLSNSNAPTADLHMTELILIPIDEFAFDVWEDGLLIQGASFTGRRLEIDSIIDPKRLMRVIAIQETLERMRTIYNSVASDQLSLHPDERQRYWFLYPTIELTTKADVCYYYAGMRNQMETTQRYLGRRGSG